MSPKADPDFVEKKINSNSVGVRNSDRLACSLRCPASRALYTIFKHPILIMSWANVYIPVKPSYAILQYAQLKGLQVSAYF
jgi:hypothetical protein